MKHIMKYIVIIAVIIASASLAIASPTPVGADIDRFPIMKGERKPLSNGQMADMHLKPIRLAADEDFLEYSRTLDAFELVRLPAGEVVLEDEDGVIRYHAWCANRLQAIAPKPAPPVVKPCPACPACQPVSPPVVPEKTFFGWLSGLGWLGWLGLGLLGLLIWAAILASVAATILLLASEWRRRNPPPAPRAPRPQQVIVVPPYGPQGPWNGPGPGWCTNRHNHRYGQWCFTCGQRTY